jgi:predicted metal-dependent phosphoesterase TrpH
MKIDLHVHARERSACSVASEEDQIRAALRAGLDALAFTDHHRLAPASRLKALNERYAPFRVFSGIEISTDGEDVLVLGLHDIALEDEDWAYPDLHAFVRERGGFLVLAHPYRYHPDLSLDVERCPPDAVEGRSSNILPVNEARIRSLAARLGVPMLCNSDAHSTKWIGSHYNVLDAAPTDKPESERDVLARLCAGKAACGGGR